MRTEEFRQLVEEKKLVIASDWGSRFVITLHIDTGRGTHIESEIVEYQPAEFAMRSSEACSRDIEAIHARLVKTATEKLRLST